MKKITKALIVFSALFGAGVSLAAPPTTFNEAKIQAKQVYSALEMKKAGTLYCGCDWFWVGRSGGRINHESCGYRTRSQQERAARLEWEHIVPASNFGRALQCWQNGGRQNCTRTDPVFNRMEADLHNLAPSVGEVNADRSNYNFGMVPDAQNAGNYGTCSFKVSFKDRVAEPPDNAKGMVARVYFYMHDRYKLRMSAQQERILMLWDKQFPVTEFEKERDRRIAQHMGHNNPFVTGEKQWKQGKTR